MLFLPGAGGRSPERERGNLAGQAVAAAILVISGVQVLLFATPALNVLLTMLWVVGITNAFNLLDNMDGLAGGVCAVAAAFFLLMAAMSGQYLVGLLAAALLGACIGFLLYNLNPASIFMGDAEPVPGVRAGGGGDQAASRRTSPL